MTSEIALLSLDVPINNFDIINGKSKLCLLNPYFKFQGIESVKLDDFMKPKFIKNDSKSKKPDTYTIINQPLIVYKLENGNTSYETCSGSGGGTSCTKTFQSYGG